MRLRVLGLTMRLRVLGLMVRPRDGIAEGVPQVVLGMVREASEDFLRSGRCTVRCGESSGGTWVRQLALAQRKFADTGVSTGVAVIWTFRAFARRSLEEAALQRRAF